MKKRILVVSDNKHLSEELQQKLVGNTDLLTVAAVSSDAGIELAFQLKPHLILLDSGLGGLSDDGVCRRLRKIWETSKIPLIVLLDAVSTGTEAYARSLGADDYLLKPPGPKNSILPQPVSAKPATVTAGAVGDALMQLLVRPARNLANKLMTQPWQGTTGQRAHRLPSMMTGS